MAQVPSEGKCGPEPSSRLGAGIGFTREGKAGTENLVLMTPCPEAGQNAAPLNVEKENPRQHTGWRMTVPGPGSLYSASSPTA